MIERSFFEYPWAVFAFVDAFGLNFAATVRLYDDPFSKEAYVVSQFFRSPIEASYWCEAQVLRILK